jgi:SAM-dependent MidA family methyltransferase
VTPYELDSGDANLALKDIIAERIRRDGPISFRDFMDLALYHPVHGYYVTCDPVRDYQSSPSVHPVFAACIGRQLAEMWRLLGGPQRFDVFEAGGGSGRLAGDVARWLREQEPEVYAALRYRLQDATFSHERISEITRQIGLPAEKVSLTRDLPEGPEVEGCILSNELIDALPVHRVRVADGRLRELRVGLEGGRFVDVPADPAPELVCHFEGLGLLPGEGCEAEVNLDAGAWIRRAAGGLRRGYLLTLDYGYRAPDLYAPWRKRGTLLTFYRHTSGEDAYARVGRQDITASVDFTTLIREGLEAGLSTLGLTTQAEFLAALGIGEAVSRPPDPRQLETFYGLRRSVIELTDPSGLGRINVLLQGKDVPDAPLLGFGGPVANG